MILYITITIIVLILIYFILVFNSCAKLNNKVNESFSNMDIYLKKRWDLIPNLVEIVKEYAKHEKTTLESIVKLRENVYDNLSLEQKLTTNEQLSEQLNKVMAIVENYPDLKASDNFQNLSTQLVKIEDDIANSRKYYNGCVRKYNDKIVIFPNVIVAKLLGYHSKKMFEAEIHERQDVKINMK